MDMVSRTSFFMPYIAPRALMEMEKLGIKRVQTHGEKAAAYMADAYARVKRAPSLCMAQSVGAVNLAAGLQDAWLSCSPVVAITGREHQQHQLRHAYQEVDHSAPFSAVTKYSAYVSKPEELSHHLRQAFRSAISGTPQPTHLDLEGIDGSMVVNMEAELQVEVESQFASLPPFRPTADQASIDEALKLMARAQRPVIVAGGGVTASGARAELIELAEKLSIPVATALNAKAMFPADHPLAVGVPGSYSRACSNRIVCEADLLFYIGSHTGGQLTNNYTIPPPGVTAIQLDINPTEIGRNYAVSVGLQGDVRNTLRQMLATAETSPPCAQWIEVDSGAGKRLVGRCRRTLQLGWRTDAPGTALQRIERKLAIRCDPRFRYRPLRRLDRHHARSSPSRAIVYPLFGITRLGIAGDDGRQMRRTGPTRLSASPFAMAASGITSRNWRRPCAAASTTVTVVNNNHSLNQERDGVEAIYGGTTAGSDELWLFDDTDFASIAESMGCLGITVTKPSEIGGALERAFAG